MNEMFITFLDQQKCYFAKIVIYGSLSVTDNQSFLIFFASIFWLSLLQK